MFKILTQRTQKFFSIKRLSAFLVLCVFLFEIGCNKKGGVAAPTSSVSEQNSIEAQI